MRHGVKSLVICAVIALVFMFAGPIRMAIVPKAFLGIVERFSVYSTIVFNAVLGLYGFIFFDLIEKKLLVLIKKS